MNENEKILKEQELRVESQKQYDRLSIEKNGVEQRNLEELRRREDTIRQEENRRIEKKVQGDKLRQEEKKNQDNSRAETPKQETSQRDLQAERRDVLQKNKEQNYYKQSHLSPKEFENAYQNVMKNLKDESQNQNQSKGSDAIEKIRAYEKSVADKVNNQLNEKNQIKHR